MDELLGGLDLSERQRRTALDLALAAWRMRSSPAAPATPVPLPSGQAPPAGASP
jgi:hypothetical protein